MRCTVIVVSILLLVMSSCTSVEQKEEMLAKQYCGSCHSFPEPVLLDKKTWTYVMPHMGLRMGVDLTMLSTLSEEDYPYVLQTLPKNPMISVADFEAIGRYYQREAPDSLTMPAATEVKELTQFEVTPIQLLKQRPTISMLQADTVGKKLLISNRSSVIYEYDYSFRRLDSARLSSPSSDVIFDGKERLISIFGIMDPNDQPKGSVGVLDNDLNVSTVIDSLKRPVYIERGDFNNDGLEDLVVCAFGNYSGALLVYENRGNGRYAKHTISSLPGSRKVIVRDFNNDGLPDILAMLTQGDEQISLFTNAGSFRFRITTLLQFPPVYGSSFFDLVDFNKDGHWDIVYTNGDNLDYSITKKPYHGVRIFLNNGENKFTESWFQHLHGCSLAFARDFDKDGDIDIATTSFFPDFYNTPEQAFVYFENVEGKMQAFTTPLATEGRWLLMETADIDGNGYTDILLGALNFDNSIPQELKQRWIQKPVDILLLKNKGKL